MDLVPMVNTLAAIGVEAELHVVGDGPDRRLLAQKLKATGSVRVVHHGGQSPEWVEAFWPTVDVAVLVSEYEGTSITMLEAMGQGVVPAVTRVESGVNEWVRDDISGITAPVGQPELLARKIAELSSDRAKLAALGSNAWNAVSAHLGIDAMASQYAEVLDAMSQREICTRPSLAGVTIGTSEHWFKRHTEDADGEVKWFVKRLTEAGYRSVAVGEPGESSDAVIIPAGDAGPDEQTALAWNKRGIDIRMECANARWRVLREAAAPHGRCGLQTHRCLWHRSALAALRRHNRVGRLPGCRVHRRQAARNQARFRTAS